MWCRATWWWTKWRYPLACCGVLRSKTQRRCQTANVSLWVVGRGVVSEVRMWGRLGRTVAWMRRERGLGLGLKECWCTHTGLLGLIPLFFTLYLKLWLSYVFMKLDVIYMVQSEGQESSPNILQCGPWSYHPRMLLYICLVLDTRKDAGFCASHMLASLHHTCMHMCWQWLDSNEFSDLLYSTF